MVNYIDIAKADLSKTSSLGDVWDVINFLDSGGQPEFVMCISYVSFTKLLYSRIKEFCR